ncbi:cytochrome P450 [Amylocarpus encephaloides]|uniref:Cytochrome P450 n=1 Tax=Amylocarpus encephaloides TaxID=45428 RepID=A0A9P7YPX7_9HELO|nr:cytochrome P450 [Amylocarpus encephaloides]
MLLNKTLHAQQRRVLSRARAEVQVFKGKDIENIKMGLEQNKCVCLRSCIEETLHMMPPVPGTLRRVVCPGGASIDGHRIPAGMEVSVDTYSILHNPKYYPEPYK